MGFKERDFIWCPGTNWWLVLFRANLQLVALAFLDMDSALFAYFTDEDCVGLEDVVKLLTRVIK